MMCEVSLLCPANATPALLLGGTAEKYRCLTSAPVALRDESAHTLDPKQNVTEAQAYIVQETSLRCEKPHELLVLDPFLCVK
ncbi:hypothetical protein NDU88_001823 [Pleurodeles waltl]|uniref:Uncharacterized protein n=1 Tax=Pleurodeles waltl TaxID=8319 RepID=A0AAV7MM11_PLEWA|nr:hypothetical protein NDU88_001823 [Pleurodeles waltl]